MKNLVVLSLMFLSLVSCGPRGNDGSQGPAGAAGIAGAQGPVGRDASIQAQPFCPDNHGVNGFQESYLNIDGQIYAVYFDRYRTFLSLLSPGNYVTTDGANCHFQITVDGHVVVL